MMRPSQLVGGALALALSLFCFTPTGAFLPPSPAALFHARPQSARALRPSVLTLRSQTRPPTSVVPGNIEQPEIRNSVSGMVPVTEGACLRYDCNFPTPHGLAPTEVTACIGLTRS